MANPKPARVLLALSMVGALSACARGPETDAAAHSPETRIRELLTTGSDPVLSLATGDTVHFGTEVTEFYRKRRYNPAWTSEEGFLPRGQALVTALQNADSEGLDPSVYHVDEIQPLIERAQSDVAQDLPVGDLLGNLDMLMTEAYVRYTGDVLRGQIDPGAEGIDWKVPRDDEMTSRALNKLLKNEDFEATLAELRPQVPFYDKLREGLARYREIAAAGGWPTVDEGEPLSEGDRSPRVAQIRSRLAAEHDPVEAPLLGGAADPELFDANLAQAVEHFQGRHGLADDGAAGAGTIAALNVPVEERIQSLHLNLDRWRWLPQELGNHYIMVNVAGFEMAVMKDNEPALTMNVVVGKTGNETPIFADTLENIVVNPYWNVPSNILRDEILPAVARDPSYLERNNMEFVGSGSNRGVRQRPGPKNALGEVKFLFPNEHDVYLHDTPADHLFSRAERAFSHGCIRLERPRELAYYLFENATLTRDRADYDRLLGGGEKWVKLREKLPVYIVYFTAWPAEDSSIHFYPDVYLRDQKVNRSLITEATAESDATALASASTGPLAR